MKYVNRGRVTNTKNGLSIIEKIKEMKGDRVKDRLEREVKKKKVEITLRKNQLWRNYVT